jgi:hypothetical protein
MQTTADDMKAMKEDLMTRMYRIDDSTIKLTDRIDLLETKIVRERTLRIIQDQTVLTQELAG